MSVETAVVVRIIDVAFDILGQALTDPRVQQELQRLADATGTEIDDLILEIWLSILTGARKTAEREND